MLELYLNLESVLDKVATNKLYSREFISGLEESLGDLKKMKCKVLIQLRIFFLEKNSKKF